ncbi:MAG: hypothetical protein K2L60_09910 [Bacteroides sp.]|nr:hypothetical protein [Bacteroides sp.]
MRAIGRGETPEQFKGSGKGISFSEEVLVFDWEGRLCHKLHLTPFVVNIAVTEDDSTLYGITESETYEPLLVRYNVSGI